MAKTRKQFILTFNADIDDGFSTNNLDLLLQGFIGDAMENVLVTSLMTGECNCCMACEGDRRSPV